MVNPRPQLPTQFQFLRSLMANPKGLLVSQFLRSLKDKSKQLPLLPLSPKSPTDKCKLLLLSPLSPRFLKDKSKQLPLPPLSPKSPTDKSKLLLLLPQSLKSLMDKSRQLQRLLQFPRSLRDKSKLPPLVPHWQLVLVLLTLPPLTFQSTLVMLLRVPSRALLSVPLLLSFCNIKENLKGVRCGQ